MDPLDLPSDPHSSRPGTRRHQGSFRPAHRRTPGAPFPVGPFAPLAHALLLAGATVAVFLAGKPAQGALGIFLLFAGAAMVACPPRIAVSGRLWLAAAALTGCAALALLPERLLPQPAWRHLLETTPLIALPGTISVAPGLTVFWLAMLVLALLTGLFLLAHPVRSHWMLTFALSAATAAGIYGALAIYARETGWHYPFASDAVFGFFPNRNHTATFLCVGSLLALGVLNVVLREGRWLLALLAGAIIAVCASGLVFFSSSRGGIVFLLAGVGLWIAGLGREHRDRRLVISFVAILLAGVVLFVVSGGEARDRMLGKTPTPKPTAAAVDAAMPGAGQGEDALHNLSADFRLKIWRDAAAAIRDFPLTGMGLGTFALVFPQYRQASLADAAAAHPESDWIMFVAEAGVPAVLCLLALVALAAGQLRSERDHAYWPLRWGVAVAVGAAVLHGMVDVPWHRVQLGGWLLVVAGLALQSARTGAVGKRSRLQHAVFVVGGLGALTLGTGLVRAQWFDGPPLPPFAAVRMQADITATFKRKDVEGAENMARQAMRDAPMVHPLYYQYGVLALHFEETDAEVDRAFRAQRLLDPISPTIPRQQGDAWLPADPGRSVTLWTEAVTRQERIDHATHATPGRAADLLANLVYEARQSPAAQRGLAPLAVQSPVYALAWAESAGPEAVASDLGRLTGQDGLMRRFTAGERTRLLLAWYGKGDREALTRFVGEHPDWQAASWPVHLRTLVDARQFEGAVREAADHYHVSLQPPPPPAANAAATSGTAPAPGGEVALAAFDNAWRAGNTVAARQELDEASKAAGQSPPFPPEGWRLKTAFAAQELTWETAWQNLENYLRQTQPSEILP